MSSQINSNSINQSFPVAGVDNNSQGFRDNFTAIKNNFTVTTREMNDLLNKVVVKAPLTYGPNPSNVANDLAGSGINNAVFAGCSTAVVDLGTISDTSTITLDFKAGGFQMVTLTGSSVSSPVIFSNFPTTGYAEIRLSVYVPSSLSHTLVLDSTETYNYVNRLDNYTPSTYTFTWPAAGTYEYLFSTHDGGATITVMPYATTINLKTSVLAANVTTTSNSWGNITGLTYNTHQGKRYNFSAVLPIQHTDSANTHSVAVGFGSGDCVYTVEQQTTTTSAFTANTATATDTGGTVTSGNANVTRMARVNGIFYDAAADTAVSVRFMTSGGTLTVLAGASLTFTPLT